jgi:TRAP-type C4-dicarboxylate transport system permease small subunit
LEQRSQQSWWARTEELGRRLETVLLVVILSGLILLASSQILLRNVFSISVNWGDGLIRLGVLWLALLGALAASGEGRHITMGDPNRWLPLRLQRPAGVITDLFATVVTGLFAWFAWTFVSDSREFGDTLLNNVPAWTLQAIMPIAFALMSLRYLVRCVRRLKAD